MLLTEFDQKSYDRGLIKVGVEKGKKEGIEEERMKNIQYVYVESFTGNNSENLRSSCRLCIGFKKEIWKIIK